MPEELKDAALFVRLCPLSKLICSKNRAFRKPSSNWRNLKMLAFVFAWTENVLKTELCENDVDTIMI